MASRLFRTDLQTKLKKEMQEKLDNERMARDFPFRPQVNEWNFTHREDVLSHLQQKETQRLQKIAALQQQRVQELQQSLTTTPAISPYSKSLTFDQPVHLRLYSLASRPPSSIDDNESERPRSSSGRPVVMADFEKLYEDAKIRRMNHEERLLKERSEQDSQTKSKKVVGHSLKLVLRKIDKDMQKITNLIWEGADSNGIITEALLADALLCTGFFKMELTGDNAALRAQQEVKALKKLCEYLQALRLLKQEGEAEMERALEREKKQMAEGEGEEGEEEIERDKEDGEGESENSSVNGSIDQIKENGDQIKENGGRGDLFEDGMDAADAIDFLSTILLRSAPTEENRYKMEEPPQTQEEHLIRRFLQLLQTGRAYTDTTKKSNDKKSPLPSEYSFQPTLNRKSLLIEAVQEKEKDTTGSPSPKRYEKLYDLSSATEEKKAAKRRETERKGMEECTFKPHVNRRHKPEELDGIKKSEALYNMSKSKKNKKDELPSHITRELKHCSFQPNLDSTKKSLETLHTTNPVTPRGVERFVDRIQQGHQEREQLQQLLERPSYPRPSALKGTPPSFLTHRARPAWAPPQLYVDIKLAHGRSGRIGIHKGDDPKVLAQNFANAFHLDAKLTAKLVDMLRMHIDNLENDELDQSGIESPPIMSPVTRERERERERERDREREGGESEEEYNRYYEDTDYSLNATGQEYM